MKKLAIFGAGATGEECIRMIGAQWVQCFVDNNRYGQMKNNIPIISFQNLLAISKDVIIIVASYNYEQEIKRQLYSENIVHFYVWTPCSSYNFNKYHPFYWADWSDSTNIQSKNYSYHDIITNLHLNAYHKLCLYCYPEMVQQMECLFEMHGLIERISFIITRTENAKELKLFKTIEGSIDGVFVAVKSPDNNIGEYLDFDSQCVASGKLAVLDIYNVERFIKKFHCPEMTAFKNIHRGKRCFIIGNGPSLMIEDLEKLYNNHELCFGANGIYKVFDSTSWRPDYYCVSDCSFYHKYKNDIISIPAKFKFIANNFCDITDDKTIVRPRFSYYEMFFPKFPRIFDDVEIQLCHMQSVLAEFMIQIAIYMGFNEIIIIGCDHNYGRFKKTTHFFTDIKEVDLSEIEGKLHAKYVGQSYIKLQRYANKKNIKILNATRGGYLETFERVDFDSFF